MSVALLNERKTRFLNGGAGGFACPVRLRTFLSQHQTGNILRRTPRPGFQHRAPSRGADPLAEIQTITDRRGVDVAFVKRSDARGVQPGLEGESLKNANGGVGGFACPVRVRTFLSRHQTVNILRRTPRPGFQHRAPSRGAEPVAEIQTITDRRGVDVAFVNRPDARGVQPGLEGESLKNALRALRPGGTLSSVSVSCGRLKVPPPITPTTSDFACEATSGAGRSEQTIASTLCPGGRTLSLWMRLVKLGSDF
jgi:hypothetical protein